LSFCLKVLGSGSAVPVFGRNHTSQALTINNNTFLIDCGEATQLQLSKFGIKKERIVAIFISHLHGDHYLGLMGLLSSMHLLGRSKPLTLVGPQGLKEIISLQLKYSATVLKYDLQFREISGETSLVFENKKLTVKAFPLQHRISCFGYRFDEKLKPVRINKERLPKDIKLLEIGSLKSGKDVLNADGSIKYSVVNHTLPPRKSRSFAFCSDTRYFKELAIHVDGVDLLYHEATFIEVHADLADKTFHSTARQAGKIAHLSNVQKLVIGHFSARYKELDTFLKEAQIEFPSTELAEDGATFCIED